MTILLGESSVGNIDLESQQSSSSVALLPIRSCTDHNNTPATRKAGSLWRRCFHAIVQVRKLLLLVNQNRARNNGNQLLLHHPLADVPYVAISIAINNGVIDVKRTRLAEYDITAVETDEAELLLPASPNGDEHDHNHREVVAETNNTSSNIGTATTADEIINQQKDRIAEITRTKDLISLTQIGGLKGVAEALNTDLEAGIPGHQEDLNRRTSTNLDIPNNTGHASTEAITSPSFFRIILNHCNNIPIMILFIAAGLSFGLGMKLDGPETGWYEGCFIMVSIIILVFAPAFRDLWEIKRSRRNRPMPILKQNSVFVYRGNIKQQVYVSQLVQGDVLLLETGCVVPADGLFIRGEFLVVHDGSESTVDEDDPFLFHGFMVTHGSGRMLVTAVGADTEFRKLMSFEASSAQTPDRIARWPAQLDWLCKVTHIIGLSFSVIILVVILVRVMLDKHFDSDTDLPQFKGKPTKSYEIMDVIEMVFMRQRGNICSNIVALLVAMVGVVEGIPFIITYVSILRIKKMLPKEAYSDLGLLSSVTVGSGTVICTDKAPLNPIDVPMCFIGAEEVINTTSSNLAKAETSIGTTSTTTAATTDDDAKSQQFANIVEIVNTKDLDSLNRFGGVKGIAVALNTNLEAGISGDENDLSWRKGQSNSDHASTGQSTEHVIEAQPSFDFLRILLKYCNDAAIGFLIIAALLSIGFGIKKDGTETGWYEGFFILVGVVILVVGPTLHELWLLARSRREPLLHLEQNLVFVSRGNTKQKIPISQLVQGDVLWLETENLVPADGLFIGGESLVVHDGLNSTINEQSPFLFHGSTVTHGSGRMLVTTVGGETKFSKLVSSGAATSQTPDRITRFPAQLERLSKVTHMAGLVISIVILVVPFVRFMIDQNFDSDSDYPKLKAGNTDTTKTKEIIDLIERLVMKPRGNMGTNLVTLLTIVMVGLMEGMSLVITLTSILWRKKLLSKIASDPGLLGSVIMGSATVVICDPLNPADVSVCFVGTDKVVNLAELPTLVREALGNGISAPLVKPSSDTGDERLNLAQWGVCLFIGIVSCPVDAAAKYTWNLTKK
ncbi:hypothetical protein G4B88_010597, partial [Cannabis sativa]